MVLVIKQIKYMKTCKRCLKNEIKVVHYIPAIRTWDSDGYLSYKNNPNKFKYIENKVNENGLCHSCEVHINKIQFDAKYIKSKMPEGYDPNAPVFKNGLYKAN
jgi:hypothetical protein